VPRELLASAIALQSAAFNAARAIGPAVGGIIVAAYGPALGFGVNAISYVAVIVVVLLIAPTLTVKVREATSVLAATRWNQVCPFTPKPATCSGWLGCSLLRCGAGDPPRAHRLSREVQASGVMLGMAPAPGEPSSGLNRRRHVNIVPYVGLFSGGILLLWRRTYGWPGWRCSSPASSGC
jgi:hypothetical protein